MTGDLHWELTTPHPSWFTPIYESSIAFLSSFKIYGCLSSLLFNEVFLWLNYRDIPFLPFPPCQAWTSSGKSFSVERLKKSGFPLPTRFTLPFFYSFIFSYNQTFYDCELQLPLFSPSNTIIYLFFEPSFIFLRLCTCESFRVKVRLNICLSIFHKSAVP